MKATLTIQESAELIKRGVNENRATSSVWCPSKNAYIYTIFTLADVCALLPKEIVTDTIMCDNDICPISIRWDNNCQKWFAGYDLVPRPVGVGVDSELIDALFSTLCWAIDNGHINLPK